MPRRSLPEHRRAKAMRSRWLGSMLAWILNTKAVMAFSCASMVRLLETCARGDGAKEASASSRSLTPKFFSAEPKNTGVRWPSRKDSKSKRRQASFTSASSSPMALASSIGFLAASAARSSGNGGAGLPSSFNSRMSPLARSQVPAKSRPRPIGQVIGAVSSASVFSISSISSNGSRLSRSILLMKVMIGMSRTRKLFEVCRLRDIPIITFINKMDRESRDPFDLMDEIEKTLALDTAPMTWPIGRGRDFAGTCDLASGDMRLLNEDGKTAPPLPLDLAALAGKNPMLDAKAISEELALVKDACRRFDFESFREGHLTPVFFGSALKNYGVKDLLDALASFAPPPRAQVSNKRTIDAHENAMTAFVFKIQANMDPNHRDRIAFARLCSGKLRRGMKAKLVRTDKPITLSAPQFFFAQDRSVADEAYAGDVVGIPNHGTLRIGDTLTEGEDIAFLG